MNVTEKIFALALASNFEPQLNFDTAYRQIQSLGETHFSNIYLIPCRDGVGEDYWNSACLLKSHLNEHEMLNLLKKIEEESGRVRPSHKISLDIDLIAWGEQLSNMQFNTKKLPLALDVKIPLCEIWQHSMFEGISLNQYPVI
ncbi:2-amino-4-hydroxy-6-hydroxymethyldihydropteridine diphosphokinase [Acinetobacter equi]|uniref:2-amino-4-hydroxy-6-hydroxymethyldihydropteridine diphosphokinase n=1 Tax=Acinetobacter equi TaxID=1324350 RepID=A0A0N9VZZ0_9GAMM|nr:2-amino-4-hydroxy-6-hydroxymethyldihydropteridine diphosphokinase [Acinetobacter equi]ALH95825.1 2-amino-4-hydroxy-6-hydroxymethyldihydropteridine pyrophosphokinase [Acinetobacter equi]